MLKYLAMLKKQRLTVKPDACPFYKLPGKLLFLITINDCSRVLTV